MVRPLTMLFVPCVLIATIIFGLTVGWTVVTAVAVANVFEGPPMLWSARQVGLFNLAPLIGLLIGLPIGGTLADQLSICSRARNQGIHQGRSRLPAALLGGIISPAGALTIGLTLSHQTPWVGPAIGWGMLTFGLTASSNVLISYAADLYPTRSGDIGIVVNVIKNLLGFGISVRSMEGYASQGPEKQFGAMAGVLWAGYILIIPLYFYSDQLHRRFRFLS